MSEPTATEPMTFFRRREKIADEFMRVINDRNRAVAEAIADMASSERGCVELLSGGNRYLAYVPRSET